MRYVPYSELDLSEQTLASFHAGYNSPQEEWNTLWGRVGGLCNSDQRCERNIERHTAWFDLEDDEKLAMRLLLGVGDYLNDCDETTEDVYDCYLHHYEDFNWAELYPMTKSAWETLGWTRVKWNNFENTGSCGPALDRDAGCASISTTIPSNDNWPLSEATPFKDLSDDEQEAAESLCFCEETWNSLRYCAEDENNPGSYIINPDFTSLHLEELTFES